MSSKATENINDCVKRFVSRKNILLRGSVDRKIRDMKCNTNEISEVSVHRDLIHLLKHIDAHFEDDYSGFRFLGINSVFVEQLNNEKYIVFVDYLIGSRFFSMKFIDRLLPIQDDSIYELDSYMASRVSDTLSEFLAEYLKDPHLILRK
jgi:hypothetical protein